MRQPNRTERGIIRSTQLASDLSVIESWVPGFNSIYIYIYSYVPRLCSHTSTWCEVLGGIIYICFASNAQSAVLSGVSWQLYMMMLIRMVWVFVLRVRETIIQAHPQHTHSVDIIHVFTMSPRDEGIIRGSLRYIGWNMFDLWNLINIKKFMLLNIGGNWLMD